LSVEFGAANADATRAVGARLARALAATSMESPLLITLSGELGAGKTTLVGGLLAEFGHAGPVRSPTYTLVEPYEFGGREVHHADLYRLRHPDELDDLGLRELQRPGAILLVEWPEKAEGRLGKVDLALTLRYGATDSRRVELVAHTAAGKAVLDRF
jgi:tRNA threonylcarbamoyladenosine biosynthesis protein TsaE